MEKHTQASESVAAIASSPADQTQGMARFPTFLYYSVAAAAAVTMRLVLKGADHLSFIRRLFDV